MVYAFIAVGLVVAFVTVRVLKAKNKTPSSSTGGSDPKDGNGRPNRS
jgi:hypothetical protein